MEKVKMKANELAELTQKDDGSYQFRLLSVSLNKIQIEDAIISVTEPDFVFTRNDEGIMIETPNVPVEFRVNKQLVKKILVPQESISIKDWTLKLRYAFSGEEKGKMQSAIYFDLTRTKQK